MSSLQGTRKGLRDTRALRECGETWAHRALFLKKGLSEAELGSEPTSCPSLSPVHLLGSVSLPPVKWKVMQSCELRAVPPALLSSSQTGKRAACKRLKTGG